MHEVALAQGILDVVLDISDGHEPRTVRIRAGELQAVTQESLQFCFEMVAQDTPAATAKLEVQIIPGDALVIDAIELDTGWLHRPESVEVEEPAHTHAEVLGSA